MIRAGEKASLWICWKLLPASMRRTDGRRQNGTVSFPLCRMKSLGNPIQQQLCEPEVQLLPSYTESYALDRGHDMQEGDIYMC